MKLQIVDSHCHLQIKYETDLESVLNRAKEAGVGMICIGTDFKASAEAVELAQQHEDIWATVGAHPTDAANESYDIMKYHSIIKHPKVVAVGEVGLDYYRTTEPEKQNQQKETLKKFLDLAIEYNKPVVIHSRDAGKGSLGLVHKDLLEILKQKLLTRCGVAHSFTGTLEEAKKYLDLGFYLGFNGIITFARQYDEMVKFVPLDRILLETDAPFLAPEPYRGKRNEPSYIIEVAKKLAELKEEPYDKVIDQTSKNATELFKFNG